MPRKSRMIQINSEICKAQNKAMFETQDMASRAMMRVWGHDSTMNIYDYHTYICPSCKKWHFGNHRVFKTYVESQSNVQA